MRVENENFTAETFENENFKMKMKIFYKNSFKNQNFLQKFFWKLKFFAIILYIDVIS